MSKSGRNRLVLPDSASPIDPEMWAPPSGETKEEFREAMLASGLDPDAPLEIMLSDIPLLRPDEVLERIHSALPTAAKFAIGDSVET